MPRADAIPRPQPRPGHQLSRNTQSRIGCCVPHRKVNDTSELVDGVVAREICDEWRDIEQFFPHLRWLAPRGTMSPRAQFQTQMLSKSSNCVTSPLTGGRRKDGTRHPVPKALLPKAQSSRRGTLTPRVSENLVRKKIPHCWRNPSNTEFSLPVAEITQCSPQESLRKYRRA